MGGSETDLPPELLVHIFTIKQDGEAVLGLKERARGEAVCRRWRATLAGNCLVDHVKLDSTCSKGLLQWLIKRRARITDLTMQLPREDWWHLTLNLLKACAGHCEVLRYVLPYMRSRGTFLSLAEALPQPHLHTPHLRTLKIASFALWDAGWVASLAQLPRLQHLELNIEPRVKGEAAVLPSMASLESLHVEMLEGFTPFRLSPQPALYHLALLSDGSPLDLRAGPAAFPNLQELCLAVEGAGAAMDFGSMAQLRAACLFVIGELEGAGTLAAATALQALSLKRYPELDDDDYVSHSLERPWVLELLRWLPQSVCELELDGHWSNGVAAALAQATQLRALALIFSQYSFHGQLAPYPPAEAPLWRTLRALDWYHCCGDTEFGQLPESFRSATKLELLQLRKDGLSNNEEESVLSLPALQHLFMPFCRSSTARDEAEEAAVGKLQARMRGGQSVHAEWLGGEHSSFLRAALDGLGL